MSCSFQKLQQHNSTSKVDISPFFDRRVKGCHFLCYDHLSLIKLFIIGYNHSKFCQVLSTWVLSVAVGTSVDLLLQFILKFNLNLNFGGQIYSNVILKKSMFPSKFEHKK